MTSHSIEHDGRRLHLVVDGPDDAPPVLVLHGITGSTATWNWLVPLLVPRHRVLRLDFRGHGRSDRTPGGYDPAGYLADAVAACEQVAGAPVLVVGHSLGGITAASLAQSRPDLVRAAVLEDPPLTAPPAGQPGADPLEGNSLRAAFAMMRESVPQLQASGIDAVTLQGILAMTPTTSGSTFGEELHDDAVAAMAEALLQLDVTVLDPVLDPSGPTRMTWVFDLDRAIGVPTLLLAADPAQPDAVCRPDASARMVAAAGDQVDLQVMTGCGHLVHDSRRHRDRLAELTLAHLSRYA